MNASPNSSALSPSWTPWRWMEHRKQPIGLFGSYECVDDDTAGAMVLEAARDWLRERYSRSRRWRRFLNRNSGVVSAVGYCRGEGLRGVVFMGGDTQRRQLTPDWRTLGVRFLTAIEDLVLREMASCVVPKPLGLKQRSLSRAERELSDWTAGVKGASCRRVQRGRHFASQSHW